jgi:hypothetical protein
MAIAITALALAYGVAGKLHLFDPGEGSNLRGDRAAQRGAAEATREAVEAEADNEPSSRAAAEQDKPAAQAPQRPKGAEPDERSALE